jgi:chemotaxis protein MotB
MARRHKHEEHANHEAWAIPYGDLITLLLAFFVVMYAMSSVNEGKYRVLSDSLVAAFQGAPKTLQPVQVGEKQVGSGADIQVTLVQQAMLEGQPRQMLEPTPIQMADISRVGHASDPATARDSESMSMSEAAHALALQRSMAMRELENVARDVETAMADLIRDELIIVRRHGLWVEVEIRTDILFPSGVARLSPESTAVLRRLADTLKPFPNPVRVEGHTDNRPIRTREFRSNWELSSARAATVVHLLMEQGVDPSRLAVIGLGEYRPSQSNDTPEGRNANRRVLLVILGSDKQPEGDPADALMDDVANDAVNGVTDGITNDGSSAAPAESMPEPPAPLTTVTAR